MRIYSRIDFRKDRIEIVGELGAPIAFNYSYIAARRDADAWIAGAATATIHPDDAQRKPTPRTKDAADKRHDEKPPSLFDEE